MRVSTILKSDQGSALAVTLVLAILVVVLGERLLNCLVFNNQETMTKRAAYRRDRLIFYVAREIRSGPTLIKTMPTNPMLINCMNNEEGSDQLDCKTLDASGNPWPIAFLNDDGVKVTGATESGAVLYTMNGEICVPTPNLSCAFAVWTDVRFTCWDPPTNNAATACPTADRIYATIHVKSLLDTSPRLNDASYVQMIPVVYMNDDLASRAGYDYRFNPRRTPTPIPVQVTGNTPASVGGGGGGPGGPPPMPTPTPPPLQVVSCPPGQTVSGTSCLSFAF